MKTPRSFAAIQARSTYHGSCKRHFNGSRPDAKSHVSAAGSRLAEFYDLFEFLTQLLSSRCGNSGARITVCQSRATGKRGLVYDVPNFGLRKSECRRLRPRRSPTQGRMQ
jgi:hypothetical protein